MQYLLAGTQIGLTYLQDSRALDRIDWTTIFDDLTDSSLPLRNWQWCDLDSLTHVILAIDRTTGRNAGVLGLTERKQKLDRWLMIDLLMTRPTDSAGTLSRAMLAHALARIVCLDGKPLAMAAGNIGRATLSDLGLNLSAAALHPPMSGNIVAFGAASLARGIGIGRTVLDLRAVAETSLLRELRRLHRIQPERKKTGQPERPMAKVARSAGATRRPRKATHIGRSG